MGAASTKESKYYPEFELNLPDLEGKTVAITGCTSGTGLVCAKCAARKGASTILLLNRESERSKNAHDAVCKELCSPDKQVVETIPCDLQDLTSVQDATKIIKSKYDKLDVLCNNAGVMALEDKPTKDGYDVQMQTNHISHFALVKGLFPLLTKSSDARIVHHSSMARKGGPLKPEYFGTNGGNLGGNGNSMLFGGARWERYHQSKLANATMTLALADKLEKHKYDQIKAVCAAPGLSQTNLQHTTNSDGGMGSGMWFMMFSQSAEDGTMPLLSSCFSPDTRNGDFWEPSKMGGMKGPAVKVEYDAVSKDPEQQKLLWEASEAACGKFL